MVDFTASGPVPSTPLWAIANPDLVCRYYAVINYGFTCTIINVQTSYSFEGTVFATQHQYYVSSPQIVVRIASANGNSYAEETKSLSQSGSKTFNYDSTRNFLTHPLVHRYYKLSGLVFANFILNDVSYPLDWEGAIIIDFDTYTANVASKYRGCSAFIATSANVLKCNIFNELSKSKVRLLIRPAYKQTILGNARIWIFFSHENPSSSSDLDWSIRAYSYYQSN